MGADLLTTDRGLLERFRQGERDALRAVWEYYCPMVRRIAQRGFGGWCGLRSVADVEDAVSATFLAAFSENSRMGYDGLTPYGGYLTGITRNVMRRQMKIAGREPVFEQTGDLLETERTPEDEFLDQEGKAALERFRLGLSASEREVFEGYFRQGSSEERLAEHLGRTRHSVRKDLKRVQKRLIRYLRDLGLC